MLAAVITGRHEVELREVPDPQPATAGVVVDISLCGICGTDVHAYQSGREYPPAVCGHEWVGVVSSRGAGVSEVSEGDRVVVAVPPACGTCSMCRSGHAAHCAAVVSAATGRDSPEARHGGFAPRLAVSANRVLRCDPSLSDAEAAQVEPVTVSLHALRRSVLRPGDVAVVQGAGPIGLTTMQLARAFGAAEVIVVEPNLQRRELAAGLGASVAVAPDDAALHIDRYTKGLGADIVFECIGHGFAVQGAVERARRGGSVCLIGMPDTDATITPSIWLRKEITITTALAYNHDDFEMAMGLMADGRIRVGSMHSATVGLAGFESAIIELGSGTSPHTKILVDPRM